MREPTLVGFERKVRAAFIHKVRHVRLVASWRQAAHIEWDGEGESIGDLWVEPFQRGIGWAVVHEMTHYIKRREMDCEGELEEPQIEGLANSVWSLIERSPRRYWWRRRTVQAKLRGSI